MINIKLIKLEEVNNIAQEILRLDNCLPESTKKAILKELREHFNLSDQQVISMAFKGILPCEPCFGEWLILLGRGELIKKEEVQDQYARDCVF